MLLEDAWLFWDENTQEKVLKTKPNQVLFALKFEVGDFGCFDVHFICKHSNCNHELECNFYSLKELERLQNSSSSVIDL